MFTHILVPTDGSELSQATVARAVAFSKETGARLTFFYAEPESPTVSYGFGSIGDPDIAKHFHERVKDISQQVIDAAERQALDQGVACDKLVRVSSRPAEAIIDAATTSGCDLIFMASHGRRGIDALLMGSETQKVLTHSKIPVLVYR